MRILSIDGGGYLGLAAAAFIGAEEDHFGVRFHERFDLFCGTSTGAIIALALASGRSGSDVINLYRAFGPRVFAHGHGSALLRSGGIFRARYSGVELRQALDKEFGESTLRAISDRGKKVLITAFNVATGHPRIFKTDHSRNLSTDGCLRIADVAMASTAAPTYLPIVQISRNGGAAEAFCDGGVVANHPALLGFVEALSELGAPAGSIRLLSLSTPRIHIGEGGLRESDLDRGLLAWRQTLPSILIDSNATIAHHIMTRLAKSYGTQSPVYERIEMSNDMKLPIDRADLEATQYLQILGSNLGASNTVRAQVARVLEVGE